MTQEHILEIYEPYEYDGQNPVPAHGIAVLRGPGRDQYYLLHVDQPMRYHSETLHQLVVMPHYNGDKIDRAVNSTCTVNIARVRDGVDLSERERLSFEDFERWGVGKISPHFDNP
ncbi:MAG TPA: hypothetical protein ENJ79_07930 [Gammaproteobacteria bacterium]|nr:hypothetical protein [Gammaproteobacteria bacterium]